MVIELNERFYIDPTDRNNITLMERYTGADQYGNKKPQTKAVAYCASIGQAVRRFADLQTVADSPANLADVLAALGRLEILCGQLPAQLDALNKKARNATSN